MADVTFIGAVAVGEQSDLGAINTTIRDLALGGGGALDETNGLVLGDAESGTGKTGIAFPDHVRDARENPVEPGSFTVLPDTFVKVNVEGFEISWQLKGNGVTSTPSAGQAKPDPGIHALLLMSGLAGSNGTSPKYQYIPALGTTYGTVKLWNFDMSYTYMDCVLASLTLEQTGGSIIIAKASFRVGSLAAIENGLTATTYDYGFQASLSAPVVQAAAYTWGQLRGFMTMSLVIDNVVNSVSDSNQATGLRWVQDERRVRCNGTVYMSTSDSDFEYQELIGAPSANAVWTIGPVTAPAAQLNSIKFTCNQLQVTKTKYDKVGIATVCILESHCTGVGGAGGADEFLAEFQ